MSKDYKIVSGEIPQISHFSAGDRVKVTLVYEGTVSEADEQGTRVVLDGSGNVLMIPAGAKQQIIRKLNRP